MFDEGGKEITLSQKNRGKNATLCVSIKVNYFIKKPAFIYIFSINLNCGNTAVSNEMKFSGTDTLTYNKK